MGEMDAITTSRAPPQLHRLRCETCEPKCRTYLDDVAVDGLYAVRLMLGTVTTMKGCASHGSAKSESGEAVLDELYEWASSWHKDTPIRDVLLLKLREKKNELRQQKKERVSP